MTTADVQTYTLIPPGAYSTNETVLGVMENWHNDNHTGVLEYCYLQPCHAIRAAVDMGTEDHEMCLPQQHDCADECEHSCPNCGDDLVCPRSDEHAAKIAERLASLDVSAKPQ